MGHMLQGEEHHHANTYGHDSVGEHPEPREVEIINHEVGHQNGCIESRAKICRDDHDGHSYTNDFLHFLKVKCLSTLLLCLLGDVAHVVVVHILANSTMVVLVDVENTDNGAHNKKHRDSHGNDSIVAPVEHDSGNACVHGHDDGH
nr:MAG TPA: hypothetical protein [Bacteriophage sp.]